MSIPKWIQPLVRVRRLLGLKGVKGVDGKQRGSVDWKPQSESPFSPKKFAGDREQRLLSLLAHSQTLPSLRTHNLSVSHKHRFVWFRVAKAGSRTLVRIFRDSDLGVREHYEVRYPPRAMEDYFKFAFVRNPWDRLVSCWLNKVRGRNFYEFGEQRLALVRSDFSAFLDFVEGLDLEVCDPHLRRQTALVDLSQVDFLGRLETFDRDVAEVFRRIGLAMPTVLPQRNRSADREPVASYYTKETAERVARLYRKDIQILGYTDQRPMSA